MCPIYMVADNRGQEFDYIIVGAGSAGCVLAARLSEDPNVRVAPLEAGGPDDAPEISLPVAFPQLFKTNYDWDFATEPEPGLRDRRIYLPRGRTLGGSSTMNAMIYIRGSPADLDGWADEGAPGWSYGEMLPYFIKSEENERGDSRYHGHSGPLSVQDGRSLHPLVDHLIEAAMGSGYRLNDDFNGARQMGVGRFQLTQRNGVRCSAASAYLHPRARTGEPGSSHRHSRAGATVRWSPRYRRVHLSSWPDRNPFFRKGNHRRGRRLWLTSHPDVVRHRSGRTNSTRLVFLWSSIFRLEPTCRTIRCCR
jgi:choline dehydrogenase-like flavoprotein